MARLDPFVKALILLLVLILSLQPSVDLDLGWHLRYGEYFFKTGQVLRDNIISFVWLHYQWVQASWGYDLVVYQLFRHFGFLGLSLTAAFITLITFLILTHPIHRFSPFQFFFLAAIFLSQTYPLYSAGLRSQTSSGIFFALLLVILSGKAVYGLPFLFLFWANLHGGFSLGLTVAFLFFLFHRDKIFALILGLSFLATFFNPYGWHIWEETIKHTTSTNLTTVIEWMPLFLFKEKAIAAIAITLLVFVTYKTGREKANRFLFVVVLLFSFLAQAALRFIIPFGIVATYFLAQSINRLGWLRFRWLKLIVSSLILVDIFFFHFFFLLPSPTIFSFSWVDYCATLGDCSEEITSLMQKDPPRGNGFHPYNYGGYLSWRVPMVKTFVDGRMPAWENNGQVPPNSDSVRAVTEKTPITFRTLDSSYHFQWAIVPTSSALRSYFDTLVKDNQWQEKLSDEQFSYYVKK